MAMNENQQPIVNKSQNVNYDDDRMGKFLDITNNLEKFYNENPDLFANEEEFKKNFNYSERSPIQQALVQGLWKKEQMKPTKPSNINEDIFGETTDEVETSVNQGTEWDELTGGDEDVEVKDEVKEEPSAVVEETKTEVKPEKVNVKERLSSLGE